MRRNSIAVGLLVACAAMLSGFAGSASAAEELPELGRCVRNVPTMVGKRKVYTGTYGNKKCTRLAHKEGHGRYEWLPGPGPHPEFYGGSEEPEPIFESVTGAKVTCGSMFMKGKYTGAKSMTVALMFSGCEEGEPPATSFGCSTDPVKEGEAEVTELTATLGQIQADPKKPHVGWKFTKTGTWMTLICGTFPSVEKLELPTINAIHAIEGSLIGELSKGFFGTNLNIMSKYQVIKFRQLKGIQVPLSFEGEASENHLSDSVTRGTTPAVKEQVGFATTTETQSGPGLSMEVPEEEEPVEIKTIP